MATHLWTMSRGSPEMDESNLDDAYLEKQCSSPNSPNVFQTHGPNVS